MEGEMGAFAAPPPPEWLFGANPGSHRERKLVDLLPDGSQPMFETLTDMANFQFVRSISFHLRIDGEVQKVRFAEPVDVFPSDELLAKVMLVV
jgi:hypothetical protein